MNSTDKQCNKKASLNMCTYIIIKAIPIHCIPTVDYGTVEPLKKQKTNSNEGESLWGELSNPKFQSVNKSASPWGLVVPALSSSQLGLQTTAPCPALLSLPCRGHAAPGVPGGDTVAFAWEGSESCGGKEVWGLAVVVSVVSVVEAAALQTEEDHCCGPLWSPVHQDLRYRNIQKYSLTAALTYKNVKLLVTWQITHCWQ